MFQLKNPTPHDWLEPVLSDFDAFLLDHAACERKASATGMSFVVKYPDRPALLEPMIEFAKEELDHFHQVVRLITERNLRLSADYKDEYVNGLRSQMRRDPDELFLDRLLVAGIVEARGCERLLLLSENLQDDLHRYTEFYRDLARAESRHHALFFRLARTYFDAKLVSQRVEQLLDFEDALVRTIPHTPRVH